MTLYLDDYLNIDSLLATQEKVKCQTSYPIKNIGLSNDNSLGGLSAGSNIDIPLWLAFVLNDSKNKVVDMKLTKAYKNSIKIMLSADASTVNLNKLGPYFYHIGSKYCDINMIKSSFDSGQIADTLLKTFIQRFCKIMDYSQSFGQNASLLPSCSNGLQMTNDHLLDKLNCFNNESNKSSIVNDIQPQLSISSLSSGISTDFLEKLDKLEENLFQIGYEESRVHAIWLSGHPESKLIKPCELVIELKRNQSSSAKKLKL